MVMPQSVFDVAAMQGALQQAARALTLELTSHQQHALLEYLRALQRWNKTYNLTAIRDPQQMLIQHVFDSLAIIAPLRRQWSGVAPIRVLDVGSGAGLPGVVIAIMQPHWQITCVDAVDKKIVFIQQVAGILGLQNVRARHTRVETLGRTDDMTAGYTLAVSRAFAALQNFATLAGTQVDAAGVLVAMKGKVPDDEIMTVAHTTAWHVTRVEPLIVPMLNAQRCLVWMQRQSGSQQDQRLHKDAYASE